MPGHRGELDLPETIDVGVMCCSPEREALEASFTGFRVGSRSPARDRRSRPAVRPVMAAGFTRG
ncbi:hypothetical protein Ait01nite_023570 [Actinoplanes italicus]|nr:hypothetical protein Ait01nite_023570 [Actinoplanes italicus]